jgi:hypothetical protein
MWIGLVLIALFERLVFDFGPNIELVTAVTVVAGIYMNKRYQVLVPLIVMMISDMYLGLGRISFFTWTGFMVMGLGVGGVRKYLSNKYILGLGGALIGNVIFYLWTNFGVWATDQWGMYENSLAGLKLSYLMGLPFLKLQLFSSWLFVPIFIFGIEMGKNFLNDFSGAKLAINWQKKVKKHDFLRIIKS